MRNLAYFGGIFHDFDSMAQALVDVMAQAGIACELSDDLDHCAQRLERGGIDLFTVYALRWRMLNGDKYAPYRRQWALEVSPQARQSIERHVSDGGGLLALHTAVICFDDWPAWGRMLGGAWVWGQSHHPARQRVEVQLLAGNHPVTSGLPDFSLVDELYQALAFEPGAQVLASGRTLGDERRHPVAWAHQFGAGRVLCDTLGHDADALRQPAHAELLQRAAHWAARL
jgi:type 1 glutamine amidotransferase